jgi:hypothetical protein
VLGFGFVNVSTLCVISSTYLQDTIALLLLVGSLAGKTSETAVPGSPDRAWRMLRYRVRGGLFLGELSHIPT